MSRKLNFDQFQLEDADCKERKDEQPLIESQERSSPAKSVHMLAAEPKQMLFERLLSQKPSRMSPSPQKKFAKIDRTSAKKVKEQPSEPDEGQKVEAQRQIRILQSHRSTNLASTL